jgi:lysophospholipase L1-like esterase
MTSLRIARLLAPFLLVAVSNACTEDGIPADEFPATSDAGDSGADLGSTDSTRNEETSSGGGSDSAAARPEAFSDAGTTSDPSTAPNGSADAGTLPGAKPKCVAKDSQVVVIGDSFINWYSHSFPEQLATATKMSWRMEAVGGTSMGSGGIGRIPDQFDLSIALDPDAHTVLMDGGGNDVLVPDLFLDALGDCRRAGSSMNPNCNMIIKLAIDAASQLMDRMAAAGIRDVVYFFYPHIPAPRLIGGDVPNEILDYALPMVESFCNSTAERTKGKLRCTFINMIPTFEGHIPGVGGVTEGSEADWFNADIHPNEKGSQAMVNKVWEVMTAKCIGQKAKDCCQP